MVTLPSVTGCAAAIGLIQSVGLAFIVSVQVSLFRIVSVRGSLGKGELRGKSDLSIVAIHYGH